MRRRDDSIAVTRQGHRDRQAAADAIGRAYLAAQRLDIAAHDPQTKAGMRRLAGVAELIGTRGEVALEDALDLVGRDAGTLVVDLQLDRLVVLRQRDDDAAAARRGPDFRSL